MLGAMRRAGPLLGTLVLLAALTAPLGEALAINPLDLIGRRPKPFVEPEGFYRVVLPSGFDCAIKKPRHVECQGKRGAQARLWLQVLDVPRSATPELVALNEMQRFRKKPHFKEISKQATTVDGSPAVTVSFSYDYLGNVEYSAGVQALYLVRQGKLYVIHFESRLSEFGRYAGDLAEVYASFKPARLDDGGNPILEPISSEADDLDPEALEKKFRGRY